MITIIDVNMNKKDNIIDYIKNKIEIGEYQYGDKIPSEEKLASLLNTSRGTVRVALEKLKFEGIIETKTGSDLFTIRQTTCLSRFLSCLGKNRE